MIGDTLGPYRVLDKLGEGGMGVVYRARDPKLGRPVAIKVLPETVAADPDSVRRLRQEASTLAALNHPNILTVHDVETEGDTVYVVTELLEGETLRQRLDRVGLDWRKASEVAAAIADGLAAAHARGVVHRDLKPDNVFLTKDGVVKLLDFGLARAEVSAEEDAATRTRATAPGTVMGTVGYMAPEQVRGEVADARSDIFSFGCVLYEMLTGRQAFKRDSWAESMSAILKERPEPAGDSLSDVPVGLSRVLTRCLEKDPHDRFQSARDLAFSLRGAATDSGSGDAPAATVPAQGGTPSRPVRWGVVAATLALAGAGLWWWLGGQSPAPAAPQTIDAIAVLPFANESGDAAMDYLGDGIAESVINRLAGLPDLRVIPRNTAFRHRGRDAEIEDVAGELGVQGIVTGRVSRRGDQLVVGVELTNAADVSQLWGDRFDTSVDQVLTVEDTIARQITDALRITMTGEQEPGGARRYTQVPAAHLAYMEARHAWNTRSTEGFQRALELYDRAIEADPGFAMAHASKAETYVLMTLYQGPPDAYTPLLRNEVATALRLDPNLAEAYPVQGFLLVLERRWADARAALERAIELRPDYATAHHWFSVYSGAIGDHDTQQVQLEVARRLDPGSPIIATDLGNAMGLLGRVREAEALYREVLDVSPTFWRAVEGLGHVYWLSGRYAEAADAFERVRELSGEIPWTDGLEVMAFARAGDRDRARQALQRMEVRAKTGYVSSFGFARAYLGLEDMDRAFEWLERAVSERDPLLMVGLHRLYPEMLADPRWTALEARMGYPR